MTDIAAAIDVGTNSTKMAVAELRDGAPRILFDRSEITRLGKGVDKSKLLSAEAVDRTLDAITRFAGEARAHGVKTIVAAGTSALRDASNGQAFIDAVRERSGVEIEIIVGDREAELAYAAVRGDRAIWSGKSANLLVFDIGGGSTELIVGTSTGVDRHRSLDIGAVRLTERFIKSDPPTDTEIAAVEEFARSAFEGFGHIDAPVEVAGIGGTAVNLATTSLGKRDANVHGLTMARAIVGDVYHRLRTLPLAERRHVPGLEPERADVFVAGAAILIQLLDFAHAPDFRVSTHGVRYGLLVECARRLTSG